jgi:hypothetical protein
MANALAAWAAQPLRTVQDYQDADAERQSRGMRNALLQMQMQQAQQGMADQQAVRNALSQHGATEQGANALMQLGAFDQAQAIQKMAQQRQQQQRVGSYLDSINPASGVARPFDPMQMLQATRDPELVKQYADVAMVKPQARNIKEVGGHLVEIPADGSAPKTLFTAPPKPEAPPEIIRLMNFRDNLPAGDPRRSVLDAQIRKSVTHAPGTTVNVDAAPKAFWTDFGKEVSGMVVDERKNAQAATGIVQNVQSIRDAANRGAYQGAGAELKLGAAKALGALGMPYDAKTVANTEVFNASANKFVLDSIKQLGANPSNADREFIEKTVPRLQTDPAALPLLLDFMENKARTQIRGYNSKAKQIQAQPNARGLPFSLEVPEPEAPQQPAGNGGWSIRPK